MNRRWICNDVWMDILPNFRRRQLGLKLALLSPRFNALVDRHFDGQSELTIWRRVIIRKKGTKAKLFVEKNNCKTMQFTMPKYPLHNKIRFQNLKIAYIDFSVIEFFHANQQIYDKDTDLRLHVPHFSYKAKELHPIWDVFARKIWPIFAPNIRHLFVSDSHDLDNLRRHTSPSILSDLNIISIRSDNLLPDAIADDGPKAKAGQALSKWLQIPTKNGKPKQLSCHEYGHTSKTKRMLKSFKEKFLDATTPSATYIIRIEFFEPTEIGPFELTNERTNEMLTLTKASENKWDDRWIMKRWQIGRTIQWKDKKTDNLSKIDFMLSGFGPLSPPKAEQINAKAPLEMNAGPSGQRKKK